MATNFSIKIDAVPIQRLADSLGRVDPADFGRVSLAALNTVTEQGYVDARAKMNAGINLSDEYLQARMQFIPAAEAARPIATVLARGDVTNLVSYGPRQNSTVVRFTNSMIAPLIKKFGPNPRKVGAVLPWKLRTGDKARGIAVDRKQAGLNVEVTRGAGKNISYAFVIKAGGRSFVAARKSDDHRGKGKVNALTGPSVYQLFRHALDPKFLQGLQTSLSNSVVTGTEALIQRAMT